VTGAQNQICVHPQLSLFPFFVLFVPFRGYPAVSVFPLRLCVSFFLILLVAGRQGLTGVVTGAASGVPESGLTDS
jgi:hypothetical protein